MYPFARPKSRNLMLGDAMTIGFRWIPLSISSERYTSRPSVSYRAISLGALETKEQQDIRGQEEIVVSLQLSPLGRIPSLPFSFFVFGGRQIGRLFAFEFRQLLN